MTASADVRVRRFGPARRELRSFLELFALCGVAVAQPALDLLGRNAAAFVTLGTSKLEAVAVAIIVVVVPPLVLWAIEVVAGLILPSCRRYVHALLAAGVVAVLAIEVLKHQSDLSAQLLVIVAAPLGLIAGFVVLRVDVARLFLRYLAIAPVFFVVLFLFASPVTTAVFEHERASAGTATVRNPKRIVMIVMDELPTMSLLDGTGHIDAGLFPNFAALADDSTWYRNNTTVAPDTNDALPAIVTGVYPSGSATSETPPVAAAYPNNLFTLLSDTYRMNVHESTTRLCPTSSCPRVGIGTSEDQFGQLLDMTSSLWREFASPRRLRSQLITGDQVDPDPLSTAAAFVRSLQPSRTPQLDFLHTQLPHQPWHLRVGKYDDAYRGPKRGTFRDVAWNTEWAALSGRQRHLLQVQAADEVLGDVIARLKDIGAYDDSLILVTADHGVAFTSRYGTRGVGPGNYAEIMWTPGLVHLPGQTDGAIDDHPVRTIDLVPTIVDVIDTKVPWKIDGQSMLAPARELGDPRIFHWAANAIKPPPGSEYLTFPGEQGLARVLGARASLFEGDEDLRLYRLGRFGGLVGKPAAPLVAKGATGPAGLVLRPENFRHVDLQAELSPWAFVQGRVDGETADVPLAVVVNGVVAGVTQTELERPGSGQADFWSTLPPELFRAGDNDVKLYLISGTPATPQLTKVRLR